MNRTIRTFEILVVGFKFRRCNHKSSIVCEEASHVRRNRSETDPVLLATLEKFLRWAQIQKYEGIWPTKRHPIGGRRSVPVDNVYILDGRDQFPDASAWETKWTRAYEGENKCEL